MESVAHGAWIWDHSKPNSRPGSIGIWLYLLVFEDSCGGDDSNVYTHEKLTWILKIAMFERRYMFKNPSYLGIYVRFRGKSNLNSSKQFGGTNIETTQKKHMASGIRIDRKPTAMSKWTCVFESRLTSSHLFKDLPTSIVLRMCQKRISGHTADEKNCWSFRCFLQNKSDKSEDDPPWGGANISHPKSLLSRWNFLFAKMGYVF